MKDIIYNLPTFELNENEKIWLEEVYVRTINYEKPTAREIWAKVFGLLPKNFDPSQINRLIVESSGERITLLGIVTLTNDFEIINKIDRILYKIREQVLRIPELTEIDLCQIADEIGLEIKEVSLLFDLASRYGSFFNSASLDQETRLPRKIKLGDEHRYFNQYLRFSGISEVIVKYVAEDMRRNNISAEKRDSQRSFLSNSFTKENANLDSRVGLIPENFNIKISNSKVQSIFQELKGIDVAIYTNGTAVLLRVFIELTIDCYLESNFLVDSNSATKSGLDLMQKILRVASHLENKNLADSSICKGIRSGVKEKDGLLGVDTLHAYVRNNNFSPKVKDLVTTWDNIQKFIEIVWANTTMPE